MIYYTPRQAEETFTKKDNYSHYEVQLLLNDCLSAYEKINAIQVLLSETEVASEKTE